MDAVVVENQMDPRSSAVRLHHEFVEEVQEQEAVLAVALDPCELAGLGIESTGEVSLLVASRSVNVLMLTGRRPLGPNLGIEVNIDFVEVESDLTRSEVVDQPLNRSQAPRPTPFRPRTINGR